MLFATYRQQIETEDIMCFKTIRDGFAMHHIFRNPNEILGKSHGMLCNKNFYVGLYDKRYRQEFGLSCPTGGLTLWL